MILFLGKADNIVASILFECDTKESKKMLKTISEEAKQALKDHIKFYSSAELKIISPMVIEDGKILNNGVLKKCDPHVKESLEKSLECKNGVGYLAFGPKVSFNNNNNKKFLRGYYQKYS